MSQSFHAAREPIPYDAAQRLQQSLVRERAAGKVPDLLWLLEHPATVTWGRAGGEQHLLRTRAQFAAAGIALVRSERGGDVTYHCPGQLVAYPIVDLRRAQDRDLPRYVRALERAAIGALRAWGLEARALPGRPGVWLEDPARKIAAIGVRVRRWIASHGLALNVTNALEGFGWIVPCGLEDAGVTSLARELPASELPPWEAVCRRLHVELEEALERPLELVRGAEIRRLCLPPGPDVSDVRKRAPPSPLHRRR